MTTVYIDPIHGAALTAGLLPILPGLPCPTCRGTGWRCRNSNLMCTHRVHQGCEDCTGSGVWTPPDSPVPIGVTSAEPGGSYGDWDVYFDHISYSLGSEDGDDNLVMHPIVLSSVIGEATLRALKVVEDIVHAPDVGPAAVDGEPTVFGGLIAETDWPHRLLLTTNRGSLDISSALPFLPGLKPDDTVYLLDGFTESVECDGGRCGLSHRGCYPGDQAWCSSCDQMIPTERNGRFVTHWHRPMRRPCPFPVDAPDHPCVLEAT